MAVQSEYFFYSSTRRIAQRVIEYSLIDEYNK